MDVNPGPVEDDFEADWAAQIAAPKRHGPSRVGVPMKPVRLRLSPTMVERVTEAARKKGWSDSTYMRCAIAHWLATTADDQVQVVRRYGGGGPDIAALTALRLQLRQTGGLITQGAKEARLAGIPTHPDLEDALAQVRQAITVITGWQSAETGPS